MSTGKVVIGPFGAPQPEDLKEQPLEQGGERNGYLDFTFARMFAQDTFGAKGLRFRVTAEDVSGNQIEADFTRK
ncbi:MAG TPA: hypothetical protein VFE63_17530, partial [Roseiarcus sp.]|nr:hypothetical protein [Roseiarcus sp.]